MFEDELILLFEKSGKIWDLRLMMDPMTGTNRGYAFITYTTKDEAQQATKDVSMNFYFSYFSSSLPHLVLGVTNRLCFVYGAYFFFF